MPKLSTESWLVSAGRPDKPGAPLNTPPVPASNYLLGGDREYARDGSTPTWEALEAIIGSIEGGESVAFASGMGAAAAVFDVLRQKISEGEFNQVANAMRKPLRDLWRERV